MLARNHEVVPLHEVTEDMRANLRELSRSIYDKIKRCRDTEKSTWKRLSALEDHVETIYQRINAIGDDLVSLYPETSHKSQRTKAIWSDHKVNDSPRH